MRPITAAVVLAVFVTSARAEDPKKVLANMQGEWKLVGLVKNGVSEPKGQLGASRLTVSKSTMTLDDAHGRFHPVDGV